MTNLIISYCVDTFIIYLLNDNYTKNANISINVVHLEGYKLFHAI